jgi:hypothetical protein
MVRQLRRNRGFSTAKLANADDTPGGGWPWVGHRPRNAGSRRWSSPATPGATTDPADAAASKELDGGRRPSVRGSARERGTWTRSASHRWWRLTSLQVSGSVQDRGFVVVAGVTSGHGDGSAVTGRRKPARQHRQRRKGLSWIRHRARQARTRCAASWCCQVGGRAR